MMDTMTLLTQVTRRTGSIPVSSWIYGALLFIVIPIGLIIVPDVPLLQPDSSSYLSFSSSRTAGYPSFLAFAQALGLGPEQIIWLQFVIYWASLCGLGWALLHATKEPMLAIGAIALILLNVEISKYNFTILTEALFISITMLICAAIVLCIFQFRLRWAVIFSGLVGAAIAVRPIGYAFLPLLPIVGWVIFLLYRPQLKILAAALLIPAVLGVFLEVLLFNTLQANPRISLLGGRLFAKSAMLDVSIANPYPPSDTRHEIWSMLEADGAKVQTIINNAPDFGTKNFLATNYEVFFEYRFARPQLIKAAKNTNLNVTDIMREIGEKRIAAAPFTFAELVWHHYRGLWTPFTVSHPVIAARANAYLSTVGELPLVGAEDVLNQPVPARRIALIIQPLLMLCWIVTVLLPIGCLIWLWRYRSLAKPWILASIFSLMINGNFLLVAIFGVGIARYALAMWPSLILAGTFALYAAWQHWGDLFTHKIREVSLRIYSKS